MAQIYVIGHVMDDLVVKQSQKDSSYICFSFSEQIDKNRRQYYQVWAWNEDVSRLMKLGVKKGSFLWLTGTLQLVDCTKEQGKVKTKIMKVFLTNWGYIPTKNSISEDMDRNNDTGQSIDSYSSLTENMDGDRIALPE